jgi:hypothetical protein
MNLYKKGYHKFKNRFLILINGFVSFLVNKYLNFRNKSNKRILVYADSRGYNYQSSSMFGSYMHTYIYQLNKMYKLDYFILNKKYTTLLDFYNKIHDQATKYDHIVCHTGIVDFAPRPKSSYDEMVLSKSSLSKKYDVPIKGVMYDSEYENEKLYSFASLEYIEKLTSLIRGLNIVYIPINYVDIKYRGTYWRNRPKIINDQLKLDNYFINNSDVKIINSCAYINKDLSRYTVDNVHLNTNGHSLLFNLLIQELRK